MRQLFPALLLGSLLAASSPAIAELLYYDPFLIGPNPLLGEYQLGPLVGDDVVFPLQNPNIGPTPFFSGPWVSPSLEDPQNIVVQADPLSYLGINSPGGSVHSIPDGRAARYLSNPLDSTTTGTYYLSYLINYGQGDFIDHRVVEMWNDTGLIGDESSLSASIGYSAFTGPLGHNDPATARMFLRVGSSAFYIIPDSPYFVDDISTHLIVLKFDLATGNNADTLSLYLDPTGTSEPILPSVMVSDVNLSLGSMSVGTVFGGVAGSGTFPVFDEVRVATTFNEALPPIPSPFDQCGDGSAEGCYTLIFQNLNTSSSDGDLSGDGRVTIEDFRLWKDYFAGGPALLLSVPEPSCLLLVVAASLAWARCLRRSC
jgi:hypothetical protein